MGSIPALTGKPIQIGLPDVAIEVYPRAYGETGEACPGATPEAGLSPRLRGNRSQPGAPGVYPRASGKPRVPVASPEEPGLSPRLRGNHVDTCAICGRDGSIPALTGKPHRLASPEEPPPVYPRAYGETQLRPVKRVKGILRVYPRAYGETRASGTGALLAIGSIPALTGKP